MGTFNELAYSAAERAGRENDVPFIGQVKVWLSNWRSKLLRDSLERTPRDRPYFMQYFEVPLVNVNVSELPGFSNISILRSKCQMRS